MTIRTSDVKPIAITHISHGSNIQHRPGMQTTDQQQEVVIFEPVKNSENLTLKARKSQRLRSWDNTITFVPRDFIGNCDSSESEEEIEEPGSTQAQSAQLKTDQTVNRLTANILNPAILKLHDTQREEESERDKLLSSEHSKWTRLSKLTNASTLNPTNLKLHDTLMEEESERDKLLSGENSAWTYLSKLINASILNPTILESRYSLQRKEESKRDRLLSSEHSKWTRLSKRVNASILKHTILESRYSFQREEASERDKLLSGENSEWTCLSKLSKKIYWQYIFKKDLLGEPYNRISGPIPAPKESFKTIADYRKCVIELYHGWAKIEPGILEYIDLPPLPQKPKENQKEKEAISPPPPLADTKNCCENAVKSKEIPSHPNQNVNSLSW